MQRFQLLLGGVFLALSAAQAQAGPVAWSVGVRLGGPVYPRPYHYAPYYPYRPYGVTYIRYPYYDPVPYVVRPTVIVADPPPPVVVEQQPVVIQGNSPQLPSQPTPVQSGVVRATSASPASTSTVDSMLQHLSNPDENARAGAATDLGRLKAERAVDPLTATLAGDRSPIVRDAAARALGLIGSPRALTALTHAAQADSDRDVRRSAQFAVEVIQANRR